MIRGFGNWYTGASPNALWTSTGGTNNPCPTGFHVPTQGEWSALLTAASITNSTQAYNSLLVLPLAGRRWYHDATPRDFGAYGWYWSSTVNTAESAYVIIFWSSNSQYRAEASSVRCIQN